MTTWVALLRGINLGPRNRVAMKDLRQLVASLGYADVETYVQSGNVVFTGEGGDASTVEQALEEGLAGELGVAAKVLVRTAAELEALVAANPWPEEAEADPTKVHVTFLSGPVSDDRLGTIDPAAHAPDELRPGDRAVYLHCPNGYGRSKLSNDLFERRLGLTATTRNWKTVTALREMARR